MKNSIKKFCLRTLLALMPVVFFIAFYAIVDPFKIVHPITNDAKGQDSVIVGNNAGFTSVETYLLYNDKYHYDSFILGSSMSQNFKASYWKPYLSDNASILHFDASSESLDGIINKMRFLNDHGTTIKNALIVIEAKMLGRKPNDNDILYVQHPATTGTWNWLRVHSLFLNAFREIKQVKYALMPSRFEKELQNEGIIIGLAPNRIGHLNEMYYAEFDSIIAVNPNEYYTSERLKRIKRVNSPSVTKPAIDETVEQKLCTINEILDKNHTNYIIIVPPRNTYPRLSWHDLWIMKSIFGQDKVHDFSSHPELVNNDLAYYDYAAHLISAKCKLILDSAYKEMNYGTIENPYFKLPKEGKGTKQ